jgi:hypothetical protein
MEKKMNNLSKESDVSDSNSYDFSTSEESLNSEKSTNVFVLGENNLDERLRRSNPFGDEEDMQMFLKFYYDADGFEDEEDPISYFKNNFKPVGGDERSNNLSLQESTRRHNNNSNQVSNSSLKKSRNGEKIIPSVSENRLAFLLQVPHLIGDALNSGNEMAIRAVIENSCLENCLFKTTALQKEVVGRHHIIQMYLAILSSIPDVISMVKAPALDHRVISVKTNFYGTKIPSTDDSGSFYWDYLKHGKDGQNKFPDAHMLNQQMLSAGKKVSFFSKSYMYLIMNSEMTAIEKFICFTRSVKVFEARGF